MGPAAHHFNPVPLSPPSSDAGSPTSTPYTHSQNPLHKRSGPAVKPTLNAQGQRTCRQCGQPGRYKYGICVENWGPGPAGPGTVCDRCRKGVGRLERRGTGDAAGLGLHIPPIPSQPHQQSRVVSPRQLFSDFYPRSPGAEAQAREYTFQTPLSAASSTWTRHGDLSARFASAVPSPPQSAESRGRGQAESREERRLRLYSRDSPPSPPFPDIGTPSNKSASQPQSGEDVAPARIVTSPASSSDPVHFLPTAQGHPGNPSLRLKQRKLEPTFGSAHPSLSSGPVTPLGAPAVHLTGPRPGSRKRRCTAAKPVGQSVTKKTKIEHDRGTPSHRAGADSMGSDAVEAEVFLNFEDIADSVTITSRNPTNSTGHFCDLFDGFHIAHGRVALKRPRMKKDDYTKQEVRSFLREANTWRLLNHNNILPYLGTCKIEGFLYMVSPYMDNGTLNEYVQKQPDVDRIRLLYEVAEGLLYLHRQGVIHGDVKSGNVLISNDIHALLCDFGLTKLPGTDTSTSLKSAGSLRWQSPELWDNQRKSFASDVYAFGMTIAEVLSGQMPFSQFDHNQQTAVIMAVSVRNERPSPEPMFTTSGATLYLAWKAAIRCWAKLPAERIAIGEVVDIIRPQGLIPDSVDSSASASIHVDDSDFGLPTLTDPNDLDFQTIPDFISVPAVESLPNSDNVSGDRIPEKTDDEPAVSQSADEGDHDAEGSADLEEHDSEGSTDHEEHDTEGSADDEEHEDTYCYCHDGGDDNMIACEGTKCSIKRFHLDCLGMTSTPRSTWLCLHCEAAEMGLILVPT